MNPVTRDEIVDYQTYADQRDGLRAEVMETKAPRRIHVGEHLTFLFENRLTVRYQVQEMMRAEQIVRESDIQHELDTYNELLGDDGELGCTLLVEIEDEADRDAKLSRWQQLPGSIYARLEDGTRVQPSYDERQNDERRISSVQFLKFDTKGRVPVAIGTDFAEIATETELSDVQRAALASDLGG